MGKNLRILPLAVPLAVIFTLAIIGLCALKGTGFLDNEHHGILEFELTRHVNEVLSPTLLNSKVSRLTSFAGKNYEQVYNSTASNIQLIEKDLINYYNVQYKGTLFIGESQTKMTFIYDTGSSLLWIPTTDCQGCHDSVQFNYKKSSTYRKHSNVPQDIQYGKGKVWGFPSSDDVYLLEGGPHVSSQYMLSVYQDDDLDGMQADGILGLSPSRHNNSQLLLYSMQKQGLIKDKVFSVALTESQTGSKIVFGGYDLEKYAAPGANVTWVPMVSSDYYSIGLEEAYIGDQKLFISAKVAIVDTGTSYLLMPTYDFSRFRMQFESSMSCNIDHDGTYYCFCSGKSYDDFPSIKISVKGNMFTIPPRSYILMSRSVCYFKIMYQDFRAQQAFWILGDNFLHGYYTIFDLEHNRVGFAGSVSKSDSGTSFGDILTFIGVMIVAGGFIALIMWACKEKRADVAPEGQHYVQMRNNP